MYFYRTKSSISKLMSSRLILELVTLFYLLPLLARPLLIPLDLPEAELPLKEMAELLLLEAI